MAIIIEQGYKRFLCKKCESLIQYSLSEVKEGKLNMDYLGDYDLYNYITCPSCNNKHVLKD